MEEGKTIVDLVLKKVNEVVNFDFLLNREENLMLDKDILKSLGVLNSTILFNSKRAFSYMPISETLTTYAKFLSSEEESPESLFKRLSGELHYKMYTLIYYILSFIKKIFIKANLNNLTRLIFLEMDSFIFPLTELRNDGSGYFDVLYKHKNNCWIKGITDENEKWLVNKFFHDEYNPHHDAIVNIFIGNKEVIDVLKNNPNLQNNLLSFMKNIISNAVLYYLKRYLGINEIRLNVCNYCGELSVIKPINDSETITDDLCFECGVRRGNNRLFYYDNLILIHNSY